MLVKVKRLNYSAPYNYAPPQEPAVVNTDDISHVVCTEARGSGPFVLVRFRDGTEMVCVGSPEMFTGREDAGNE